MKNKYKNNNNFKTKYTRIVEGGEDQVVVNAESCGVGIMVVMEKTSNETNVLIFFLS